MIVIFKGNGRIRSLSRAHDIGMLVVEFEDGSSVSLCELSGAVHVAGASPQTEAEALSSLLLIQEEDSGTTITFDVSREDEDRLRLLIEDHQGGIQ